MRMGSLGGAKTLALQLLDQLSNHISARILWKLVSRGFPIYYIPSRKPFPALHCVSYFGIAELANTLIETNRWDVNQKDSAGMTPLIWAARYGHEGVVRLFLREKHIHPDQQDTNYGRTALPWAAEYGHEGVVRFFLSPEFGDPRSIGGWWGKALRVVGGRLSSMKYVNPNSPSKHGRTPLSWASGRGHEGTVKLLLRREDVNPNIPDTEYGRARLSWAAGSGRGGVVKLFVGAQRCQPG